MAIIYSYPTVVPTSDDLILGTDVNADGKPTKNFTIQSVVDIVSGGAAGLGAVLKINSSAKDPATQQNQSATDFINVQGTGTFTAGTFTDGAMTVTNGIGIGFTSITSTDFVGNITGIVKVGSSIAGNADGVEANNVLGVTQPVGTNNKTLATTAFVMNKIDPSVLTFVGTSGGNQTVNLATQSFDLLGTANEIESVGTAQTITFGFPAAGVVLPDGSTATTQAATDDSTKVATTAFVRDYDDTQDLDFSGTTGTGAVLLNSQTLAIAGTNNQVVTSAAGQTLTIALTNPIVTNLTGNVTGILKATSSIAGVAGGTDAENVLAVTQTAGDNSTRIATTAYVDAAAGAKTLDYAGDSTGPFALNLSTDDLEFNGDSNITVTAAAVAATKGIVTIDLNNDVGISGTMTAGTFTDGTFTGSSGTYTGYVSITSAAFVGPLTGNATTATALAAPGTIQLLSGSGATQGVASNAVTYTSGGDVQLTTTLADTTVTAKALTNLPTPTSSAIAASDTILAAMAKLQGQITGIAGSLAFEGTWDARTVAEGGAGTPPSATPVNGQFWIVDPAGSQNLDGITDWLVGDWAIYVSNGAGTDAWQKLDQSNEVLGSGAANKIAKWTSSNTLATGLISDDGTDVTIGTNGNLIVQGNTTLGDDAAADTITLNGPTTFESTGRFKKGLALGAATDGTEYGATGQVLTASTSAGSPPTWTTPTVGVVTSITGDYGITVAGTAAVPTIAVTSDVNNLINQATAKATPVGADSILINDSASTPANALKKATLTSIKTFTAESWLLDVDGGTPATISDGDQVGFNSGTGIVQTISTKDVTTAIDYVGNNNAIEAAADGTGITVAATDKLWVSDADDNTIKQINVSQVSGVLDQGLPDVLAINNASGANNIAMADSQKITFGASGDLEIFHDTSNSYINTTSGSAGDLFIDSQGTGHDLYLQATDDVFIRPQGGEDGIKVIGDGAVELYHNGSKKFETTSTGVSVTGGGVFTGDITAAVGTFKAPAASASIINAFQADNGNNAATFRTTTTGYVFEIRSQNSGTIKIDTSLATFTGNVEIDGNLTVDGNIIHGGKGGTFTGSAALTDGVQGNLFTLTRANTGTLMFDVWLTSGDNTTESICKRFTVARSYGVVSPPFNKLIDTGPVSSNDFAVSFVGDSTTGVICKVTPSGTNQTISYTVMVGFDSVNTLTVS